MKCPSCAAENTNTSLFCLNCGAKLPTPPPQEEPIAFVPAEPEVEAEAAAEPEVEAEAEPEVEPEQEAEQPRIIYAEPEAEPAPAVTESGCPVISTKNWLGTLLLWMGIPFVLGLITLGIGLWLGVDNIAFSILSFLSSISSIVFVLIMAFNRKVNPSKRGFFQAYLWLILIMVILVIVLTILVVIFAATWLESGSAEFLQMLESMPEISPYI